MRDLNPQIPLMLTPVVWLKKFVQKLYLQENKVKRLLRKLAKATPPKGSRSSGGIDLNSANFNLQIKRDGHGVPLPISGQDLEDINIDGLVPVIIDIKPAAGLPVL